MRLARERGERGATLVEAAFIIPILVTFVFGTIEFGFVFNNYNSIRSGVREGARQGVVGNTSAGSCNTTTDLNVSGTPSTATKNLMCEVKDRIGIKPYSDVRVKIYMDTSYAVGQGLVVCAQYPLKSITGLFSFALSGSLHSKVEMRIEQDTAGLDSTAQSENLQSGLTWGTWC